MNHKAITSDREKNLRVATNDILKLVASEPKGGRGV